MSEEDAMKMKVLQRNQALYIYHPSAPASLPLILLILPASPISYSPIISYPPLASISLSLSLCSPSSSFHFSSTLSYPLPLPISILSLPTYLYPTSLVLIPPPLSPPSLSLPSLLVFSFSFPFSSVRLDRRRRQFP